MFKFTEHTGLVVPLDISNIDTDTIIPKQFLQKVNRKGFGKYLFHDWRFLDSYQSKINNDFILNKNVYLNSSILLTRDNFGCGSSREHAVWSLMDYGFKVIIAPSFASIFYNNAFNNKLLLITLNNQEIDYLFNIVKENLGILFSVSLVDKKITVNEKNFSFELDDFRCMFFLTDLDNIDLTMQYLSKIEDYENKNFDFLKRRIEFQSNI